MPNAPGSFGFISTLANTYGRPIMVLPRSCGSSSMCQLLVPQKNTAELDGSTEHGCWSLPPIADGNASTLRPRSSGECAATLTGRPVFMSMRSAQLAGTNLLARSSVPSRRSST
ncbi:hypothetical protein NB705_000830 [Xanthomonas sacchari]|nr:hypothetical protein [Xanthomonas sacchari]